MKTFNVSVTLVYEAEDETDAETVAENALSLIPKGAEPSFYEVHYAELNHE